MMGLQELFHPQKLRAARSLKVLFVYTNINGFHYDSYHFGVASLVSVTRDAHHEPRIIVLTEKNHFEKFERELKEFKPDVIGFSAVSSQFMFIKELAGIAKTIFPETITVCGGVHPTLDQNCILECDDLDGLIRGESEVAFVEFLENVANHEDYRQSGNFTYVENGKVIANGLKPLIDDLSILPSPDKNLYPYHEVSIMTTGAAPFFFTRGCPFTCTYCFNHQWAVLYGRKRNYPRFRKAELCIQEIEEVVERHGSDVGYVYIGDDIFGLDDAWRKEFCEKYKERILRKYNIRFMILLRVEMCQDIRFLKMLKDSGCFRLFFGVESGDEEQRKVALDRKMSDKTIIKAFDLARKAGLETLAVNIIGFPDESEEMIKKTIELNRRLRPSSSGVNIFYPYKGTILGDKCFKENRVDIDAFEECSNERRESVLRFPKEHLDMIMHYYKNWDRFVFPIWTRTGLYSRFVKLVIRLGLLDVAIKMKRHVHRLLGIRSRFPAWVRPGRAA